MNKTVIFTYDTAGNITERCEYAYTSKDGEELSELECTHHTYEYDGDRLMRYDGEPCVYDANGNILTYCGRTTTFDTMGRLQKYGETRIVYNGDGTRESKEYLTFTYDSNGRLIKQSNGLEFIYDNSGVIGVNYNNAQYFYRRDAQGNIIALIDNTGDVVVEYKYDAWGNHEAIVANEAYVALANLNPFRYRGYYFDEETGLYFLQTRYYDPEVGRFIFRDSIEYAGPETICGLNLYAYCGNNPVMNVDPSGSYAMSVSSLIDIVSALTEIGIGGGISLVAWVYKTSIRPNNIGIGAYKRFIGNKLSRFATVSKILSKISTATAIVSVGVSVIENIIYDVQNNKYDFGRTLSNAVTNIAIYGGTTLGIGVIGGKIGAVLGSVIPGLGNVIGAAIGFALGICIGLLLDLKINGKSIIDHIRDGFYNFWKWLFGG